jgi:MFS family permease
MSAADRVRPSDASADVPALLPRRAAVVMLLAFASAYFLSALVRAVTATLAPVFSQELALGAAQLGLLAGAYFVGFAAMQLPLGIALDRFGPRRVLIALLFVAVAGSVAFAVAQTLPQLLVARLFIGVGVAGCLMAPLTAFRHHFAPELQLRANAWMLMTGSFGMLASTLPVQWLLPYTGWRGLFLGLAVAVLAAIVVVARAVPRDRPPSAEAGASPITTNARAGYAQVFAHPSFVALAPLGFFAYGGLVAMQTLWIGPWLTQVAGYSPAAAATGLFAVNASMLMAFLVWGAAIPRLLRAGWSGERVIAVAWWPSCLVLATIVWLGEGAATGWWALWCVCTSVVSLSQPALGQAFPAALAGRALSAYNLILFAGVFVVQWGLGLLIDLLLGSGWSATAAYRAAFGVFLSACVASFGWFVIYRRGSAQPDPTR